MNQINETTFEIYVNIVRQYHTYHSHYTQDDYSLCQKFNNPELLQFINEAVTNNQIQQNKFYKDQIVFKNKLTCDKFYTACIKLSKIKKTKNIYLEYQHALCIMENILQLIVIGEEIMVNNWEYREKTCFEYNLHNKEQEDKKQEFEKLLKELEQKHNKEKQELLMKHTEEIGELVLKMFQ